MKTGKITVLDYQEETGKFNDIIFRSQDGTTELSFEEWFNELEIDFIIHRGRINEE
ncbi:hypothetical protein [Draconibacterium sediminis]|uniref:hypothetical protein n=1 Tax=Draconibacterium sediminis TaxID=1544798 RepID=UPI0012FA72AC|nr:hypothetical protein [Draconibacterium sediminis]